MPRTGLKTPPRRANLSVSASNAARPRPTGALAIIADALLGGCDFGRWAETKCPWPVIETRLAYAGRFERDPIGWPDNDRGLVSGPMGRSALSTAPGAMQ
jgi:hypothetical protein